MRTVISPMWSGLGMNVGSNFNFDVEYPTSQVNKDLDYLKSVGFTKIRCACPTYDSSVGIANIKLLALAAKSRGFYVIVGITSGGTSFGTSSQAAYQTTLDDLTAFCITNNIDELQVGNEMENHVDGTTMSLDDVRPFIRNLATRVKTDLGYTGKISYSCGQGFSTKSAAWIADGNLGDLDYLPINVYGDYPNDYNLGFNYYLSQIYNKFGDRTYVSEFNVFYTWTNVVSQLPIENIIKQVQNRLNVVKNSGVKRGYFFCWRFDSDYFSAKLNNEDIHPMFWQLIGSRKPTTIRTSISRSSANRNII
jgi:hypothetical protein